MKRIIAFLLVLSILMTSFACTSKTKPESFIPLQSKLISVVYPDKPNQLLKIEWIHTEAIAVLRGDEWINDPSVLNREGTLILQVKDQARDLYQFYTSNQDPSMSYVIVTQDSDDKHLGFAIPTSTLDDFLTLLMDYAESIKVLQYPLVSITDVVNDGFPIRNPSLLSSLPSAMMPELWIRVNIEVPMETQKRIILTDDHGDTYTFYTDAGTTQQYTLIVVDRQDQSQQIFTASFQVLNTLFRFLNDHPFDANDHWTQLLRTSVPVSVYLGQFSDYADSKLIELSSSVVEILQDQFLVTSAYYRPSDKPFDPHAKALFMIKTADGNYLTVYTVASTTLYEDTDSDCWVSFGKDPFDGPNNDHFMMYISDANELHRKIAWSPNGEVKDLEILVDTTDAFVFPAFTYGGIGDSRYEPYSGQLNQAMVNFLNDLEDLDWTVVTWDQFTSIWDYPASLIITTSSGTQYIIPEFRNQIIVDEDPFTPGAIIYQITEPTNFSSFGTLIYDLEYLAQLESNLDLSLLSITGYSISNPDDETVESFTYSSSESQTLTELLRSSTLYLKTYDPFTWTRSFEAHLNLSDGSRIGFFYINTQKKDYPYGLVSFFDEKAIKPSVYYMPIEEFTAIIDLYKSYLD